MSIQQRIIGDTIKAVWVDSGVTPTTVYTTLLNSSDTMVNSTAMTSSGNGHYYGLHTLPATPGFYVVQTHAVIQTFPYINRIKVEAIRGEVD